MVMKAGKLMLLVLHLPGNELQLTRVVEGVQTIEFVAKRN